MSPYTKRFYIDDNKNITVTYNDRRTNPRWDRNSELFSLEKDLLAAYPMIQPKKIHRNQIHFNMPGIGWLAMMLNYFAEGNVAFNYLKEMQLSGNTALAQAILKLAQEFPVDLSQTTLLGLMADPTFTSALQCGVLDLMKLNPAKLEICTANLPQFNINSIICRHIPPILQQNNQLEKNSATQMQQNQKLNEDNAALAKRVRHNEPLERIAAATKIQSFFRGRMTHKQFVTIETAIRDFSRDGKHELAGQLRKSLQDQDFKSALKLIENPDAAQKEKLAAMGKLKQETMQRLQIEGAIKEYSRAGKYELAQLLKNTLKANNFEQALAVISQDKQVAETPKISNRRP